MAKDAKTQHSCMHGIARASRAGVLVHPVADEVHRADVRSAPGRRRSRPGTARATSCGLSPLRVGPQKTSFVSAEAHADLSLAGPKRP
eukprot:13143302-Alexandrium_andersonii.AAC.1